MPHTLLLADDSTTIQRVVELTFASEDIDVVTVGDGTKAIEAIERGEPDIVLADVSMPGRDGYEVASFVRSDPARDRIPVVLLTGAFEPLDESRCDAIGRHEVLVKPFEPRQVVGKVRELLDLPPKEAPAAVPPAAVAPAGELVADPPEAVVAAGTAVAVEAAVGEAPAADAAEPVGASVPEEPASDSAGAVEEAVPDGSEAGSGEGMAEVASEAPAAAAETVAGGGVGVPPVGAGGSVLAQSFVTFLAVEQGAEPPALTRAPGAEGEAPGPQVTDETMDELVDRVVRRLRETVLRDTVAEVVSRLGEQLAQAEIPSAAPDAE
ncbi:MAG: response regulator [Acidobacteria bacterium]|nr:response regulator [Acidobacteriota bacterium]